MDKSYPIPARLNLFLAAGLLGGAVCLLGLASRLDLVWALPIGILFSFLLLTNYALLHEGTHDILHPDPRVNDSLGMVLSWLFPVPFTLLKVTHTVHHCYNRTDHEMFDCYYPGDNRVVKFFQWYGLMFGVWWYVIPIGSLLLALVPRWLHTPPFKRARSTAVLFDDFGPAEIRRVRIETALGVAFWAALFHGLHLRWDAVLVAYACFALNWSTRQYIAHAFTPRHVRDGALNLRVSRPMGWLLLNGQWDRVHHQHPHVPWRYLADIGEKEGYDIGYWRQYARLWAGPRPCRETAASILPRNRYRAMQ